MRFFFLLTMFFLFIYCKNDNAQFAENQSSELNVRLVSQRLENVEPLYQQFYDTHKNYKEQIIKSRNFKLATIAPLMQRLKAPFKVSKAGKSIENRDIYRVSLGTGKTQVLLWSQMHGDESTATMAIMDLFNFLVKAEMNLMHIGKRF